MPTASDRVRVATCDIETTLPLLPNRKIRRVLSRAAHWGLVAAVQALQDACVNVFPCADHRLGVFASGAVNFEEFTHVYAVLRSMREQGLDWRDTFGEIAIQQLPPLMLLRRLPNAAFCHVAQLAKARGYNATLMTGPLSGLDCLHQAAVAIQDGRLDAALVVSHDAPVTWEFMANLAYLLEATGQPHPIVLSEGGIALYLEREDLYPQRERRPYARFVARAATQAREGVVFFGPTLSVPRHGLREAVARATMKAVMGYDPAAIAYLDLSDVGLDWLDEAERAACQCAPRATVGSATARTGYLGNASGALGLARLCYLLAEASAGTSGLVVRAALTGQCSAILLQVAEPGEREQHVGNA
jgi:3-oxoacyl-[acyl-carrier-protein] synthase II